MVLLLRRLPTTHFARALSGGVRDPHSVLGLPINSGREAIRRRYFELAKTTHPDTRSAAADGTAAEDSSNGPGDPSADFVELHAAFESLMRSAASSTPSSEKGSSSAASTSARGGGGQWARKGAARARPFEPRTVSLAEVLALRLEEEPDELDAVWAEIVSRGLEVDAPAADALFRACSRSSSQHAGMAGALRLLREASAKGLLSGAHRSAALVSLLTWCKEDELDCTFELCDEVTDADRTPEVLAALSAAFAGFGGVGSSF